MVAAFADPSCITLNPIPSMNRSTANQMKAFCLTLIVAIAMMPSIDAGLAGQERAANSYRTDLWKMEFQKEEEQKEESEDATDQEGGPSNAVRRAAEEGFREWGEIPGQVYLADISQQTPFAEWQVNRSAAGQYQHFSSGPTAWVMSQVRAKGSGFNPEMPQTNGPSMLTLLVAVIACMVMIGAMFADR